MFTLLALVIRIYRLGTGAAFEALGDKFSTLVLNLLKHFPRPLKMADDIIMFLTGFTGIVLTIPDMGVRELVMEHIELKKIRGRALRADVAVASFFDAQIEGIKTATGTGENSLVEFMLQRAAFALYSFILKVKFLAAVLKVKSAEELAQVWIQSWRSKFNVLRAVAIVFALVAGALKLGVIFSAASFVLGYPAFAKNFFRQDNPRVKHSKYLARVSSRRRSGA